MNYLPRKAKQFLAMLICLLMLTSMLPLSAFAADTYTVNVKYTSNTAKGYPIVDPETTSGPSMGPHSLPIGTPFNKGFPEVEGYTLSTKMARVGNQYLIAGVNFTNQQIVNWTGTQDVEIEFFFDANFYTVKILRPDGVPIHRFTVNAGSTISQADLDNIRAKLPAGEAYAGLYMDSRLNNPWNESLVVPNNLTLYISTGQAQNCIVNFDAAGGSPTPAQQIVNLGGKVIEPTAPTRAGYTFVGWGWNSNPNEIYNFDWTRDTAGVLNLKAIWNEIKKTSYTITITSTTYPTTGASFQGPLPPQEITENINVATTSISQNPTVPTGFVLNEIRFKYGNNTLTFYPSYSTGVFTSFLQAATSVWTNDCTIEYIYSIAQIPNYNVTFVNNGVTVKTISVPGYSLIPQTEIPVVTYGDPLVWEFDNWYHDSLFKHTFDFTYDIVDKPITLYANWNKISYKVNITYTVDQPGYTGAPLPSPRPAIEYTYVPVGESFIGPNPKHELVLGDIGDYILTSVKLNGNANTVLSANWIASPPTAESRVKAATKDFTQDLTLDYVFKVGSFTVTFDGNSGYVRNIGDPWSDTTRKWIAPGAKIENGPLAYKVGYKLWGWYYQKDDGTYAPWDLNNDPVVKTMTLYAGWEALELTGVAFDQGVVNGTVGAFTAVVKGTTSPKRVDLDEVVFEISNVSDSNTIYMDLILPSGIIYGRYLLVSPNGDGRYIFADSSAYGDYFNGDVITYEIFDFANGVRVDIGTFTVTVDIPVYIEYFNGYWYNDAAGVEGSVTNWNPFVAGTEDYFYKGASLVRWEQKEISGIWVVHTPGALTVEVYQNGAKVLPNIVSNTAFFRHDPIGLASPVEYRIWSGNVQIATLTVVPTMKVNIDPDNWTTSYYEWPSYNDTLTAPSDPVKTDNIFNGWYVYNEVTGGYDPYTFGTPVTKDLQLKAGWIEQFTVKFVSSGPAFELRAMPSQSQGGDNYTVYQKLTALDFAESPEIIYTPAAWDFIGWFEDVTDDTTQWFPSDAITRNMTLTTKFVLHTYTVRFAPDNGEDPVNVANISHGDTIGWAKWPWGTAGPTRTGYTFDGWYEDTTDSTTRYYDYTSITKNTTLHAKWDPILYTVRFFVNKTDALPYDEIYVYYDNVIPLDKVPDLSAYDPNYKFLSWFDMADDTAWFDAKKVVDNVNLYGTWQRLWIVEFNPENGDAAQFITIGNGEAIGAANWPSDPTATGYTFGGWYTVRSGIGDLYTDATIITAGVNLFAHWIADPRVVTFYALDADTPFSNSVTVSYNTPVGWDKWPVPDPVKTGYTFQGWFDLTTTPSTQYWPGFTPVTDDVTLTAVWDTNLYTVRFFDNGIGTSTVTLPWPQYVLYGQFATEPIFAIHNDYRFDGWYKDNGLWLEPWNEAMPITGNLDVYARWTPYRYVTFDAWYGALDSTTVSPLKVAAGDTFAEPANPTRTGFTFTGWYNSSSAGVKWDFATDKMLAYNFTLYARWNVDPRYVTFQAPDADTPIVDRIVAVDYNTPTGADMPPDPTRVGFVFAGWFSDLNDPGTQYVSTTLIVNNVTLFAKWTIAQCYVVYTWDHNGYYSSFGLETVGYNYGDVATDKLPKRTPDEQWMVEGWYTDTACTLPYGFTPLTGNVVLYAKWVSNLWMVSYDYMNGYVWEEQVTNGSLAQYRFHPNGSSQVAIWCTDTTLATEWDYTTPITADTTLYAKWVNNEVTVKYDYTTHSGTVYEEKTTYGSNANYELFEHDREIATWCKDPALTIPWDYSNDIITGDTTLYARWKPNWSITAINGLVYVGGVGYTIVPGDFEVTGTHTYTICPSQIVEGIDFTNQTVMQLDIPGLTGPLSAVLIFNSAPDPRIVFDIFPPSGGSGDTYEIETFDLGLLPMTDGAYSLVIMEGGTTIATIIFTN